MRRVDPLWVRKIYQGLRAAIYGGPIVAVFMVIYYSVFGLLNFALALNILILLELLLC